MGLDHACTVGLVEHAPVGVRLTANHRTRHLQCKKNHRHRSGYVDNSLPRVPAHPHCATTTAFSSRNPMVDPQETLALPKGVEHWPLTTLREKLIKIDAKVVRHGRYITFPSPKSPSQEPCSPRFCASLMGCGRSFCRHDRPRIRSIHITGRTGLCGAGRGTLSAHEVTTGQGFPQKIRPIRGLIVIYRTV